METTTSFESTPSTTFDSSHAKPDPDMSDSSRSGSGSGAGSGTGASGVDDSAAAVGGNPIPTFDQFLLPTEEARLQLRKKAQFKAAPTRDVPPLTADIVRLENVFISGSDKKGWYLNYHFYDLVTGENIIVPFNLSLGHEDFPEYIEPWREAAYAESGVAITRRPGLLIVLSKEGPKVWKKPGGGADDDSSGKPKSRSLFSGITSTIERELLIKLPSRIQDLVLEKDIFKLGTNAELLKLASEPLSDDEEYACYQIKDPPAKPQMDQVTSSVREKLMVRYEKELIEYNEKLGGIKALVGERAVSIYLARKVVSSARAYLDTIPAGKQSPMFRPLVSIKTSVETSEDFKAKEGEEPRMKTQVGISVNLDEGSSHKPTEVWFMTPEVDEETKIIKRDEDGYPIREPLAATCDDLKYRTVHSLVAVTGKMFTASGQSGFTFYGRQYGIYLDLLEQVGRGGGESDASANDVIMVGRNRIAKPTGLLSEQELRRIDELRAMQTKKLDELTKKDPAAGTGTEDTSDFAMATFSGFDRPEGGAADSTSRQTFKRPAASDLSSFGKKSRN